MSKLHKFFLYNFLGIYIATFFIIFFVGYFTLKTILLNQIKDELRVSLKYTSLLLPHIKNLKSFVIEIHKISKDRITIIDNNGEILAQSHLNSEKYMNKPKIILVKQEKYNLLIKISKNSKQKYLYLIKYIKYNKHYIYIRISKNLTDIYYQFHIMYIKIISIFLLFMIISLIITYKMNKKVKYDIDQITNYLNEISDKNYKAIIKVKYFNEFLYISILLKDLVKKLLNREKKKDKYNAKLRFINKQRTQMLSAISHEFKNPIAAIMGYTQTIREDEEININIRNRFLDKIFKNAKKISDMIDRLALSIKLENNNLTISPTKFDILELCIEVKNLLNIKYKDRNIILQVNNFLITADKTMLELVITNLVENALKYSEDDVKIILQNRIILIEDQGIGFSELQSKKIISKFYRIKTNSWDNSMGLGLAIVTYILKLHNVELIIKSKPHIGSTFGFDLKSFIHDN